MINVTMKLGTWPEAVETIVMLSLSLKDTSNFIYLFILQGGEGGEWNWVTQVSIYVNKRMINIHADRLVLSSDPHSNRLLKLT